MSDSVSAARIWRQRIERLDTWDDQQDEAIEQITKELPSDESLVTITARQLNVLMRQSSIANGYLYIIARLLAERADREIT